jgi:acyl-CoA reductase-like NAD-dependent aldehyde dehydrogenase
MALKAINPATGETIHSYDDMSPAQVEEAIARAHTAFLS